MSDAKRLAIAAVIAAALVAPFEGLRTVAYKDPVGIPTICFGYTHGVKMGDVKTEAECKALLTDEVASSVAQVERCVPGLQPNQLAAWASAVYNIGPRIVCDTTNSTAARLLKAGRYTEACHQLPRWDKAKGITLPGLTRRRLAEMNLCLEAV